MFEMLRYAGIISHFEKEPSFDRLFPNQDFHSGKGFGNLIALPLNGKSIKQGNSCFLNPETFEVYENQWDFLQEIKKVSKEKLRGLFEELFDINPADILGSFNIDAIPELEIIIGTQIYLKRVQISRKLIRFLREQLNFFNSDYLIKKNLGKSTFDTEKVLQPDSGI
jgi:hypothetical protein